MFTSYYVLTYINQNIKYNFKIVNYKNKYKLNIFIRILVYLIDNSFILSILHSFHILNFLIITCYFNI